MFIRNSNIGNRSGPFVAALQIVAALKGFDSIKLAKSSQMV
jgi:hypothetical protein